MMTTVEALNGLSRLMLGYVFLSSGSFKVFLDTPTLVKEWGASMAEHPSFGLRVLGMVEVLAAVVLVVPMVLNVPQVLTTCGAVIVVAVMVGDLINKVRTGRVKSISLNVALAAVAGFVVVTQSMR